jgi:type IV pilus assembly protein PilA
VTRQVAFTLLQLLAALAVACILMLIAVPTYLDKLVRDQVLEALPLARLPRPAVARAWETRGPMPADNAAARVPEPARIANRVVRSVTVEDGAVHLLFGNEAHPSLRGRTLTLRPAGVEALRIVPVVWVCGYAQAPAPKVAFGINRTDVPAGLLPARCR